MLTDVQIANLALLRMGVHKQLTSLADNSTESKAVNVLLDPIKKELLGSAHWQFARTAKSLTPALTLDVLQPNWPYAFERPVDCETAIEIDAGARFPAREARIAFAEGYGTVATVGKRLILCDSATPTLLYISTTPLATAGLVPLYFDHAVAAKLAAALAMALPDKADLAAGLERYAELERQRAVARDMNAQQPDREPESIFIRARG